MAEQDFLESSSKEQINQGASWTWIIPKNTLSRKLPMAR